MAGAGVPGQFCSGAAGARLGQGVDVPRVEPDSFPGQQVVVDGLPQECATWFRVTAFGKLAETCHAFLRKGSYAYVEGTLSQRDWTDREGANRVSLEVRAREMRMLDKRGAGLDGETARPSGGLPPASSDDDLTMDDVPF